MCSKPSSLLNKLYRFLSMEVSWQVYFKNVEILQKDDFIIRYRDGLCDHIQDLGDKEYSMEDVYAYVLSKASEDTSITLLPSINDFKPKFDSLPLFTQVCRDYYNNSINESVIDLLKHLDEHLSPASFYCKYIPKMYKLLNPRTTRFIHPFYVSRVILDDIIFESFVDDYIGQDLQHNALPILFRESLGTQYSHSLAEGYKEYINRMYKKKPVRRYVEKLVYAIYHNQSLSDRDKKTLIKKIDTLDEKRCRMYKEKLPDKTYHDIYYPKGQQRPYMRIVSVPFGGMNKRH